MLVTMEVKNAVLVSTAATVALVSTRTKHLRQSKKTIRIGIKFWMVNQDWRSLLDMKMGKLNMGKTFSVKQKRISETKRENYYSRSRKS